MNGFYELNNGVAFAVRSYGRKTCSGWGDDHSSIIKMPIEKNSIRFRQLFKRMSDIVSRQVRPHIKTKGPKGPARRAIKNGIFFVRIFDRPQKKSPSEYRRGFKFIDRVTLTALPT